MMTKCGVEISDAMFAKKMKGLINQFYKILPIKESGESTLVQYMKSLQREMLGCKSLIEALDNDAQYLSLLAILQYMIEHECDVGTVKSEVFKAIGILKRMQARFACDADAPEKGGPA